MKYFLSVILFCFSTLGFANDMAISYADFLIMTKDQKIKTIGLLQDFMTEFEQQQILHLGQKTSRYESYKKLLEKIFIASAYAGDPPSYFTNDPRYSVPERQCIFAGNVSYMYQHEGRHLCRSPSREVPVVQRSNSFDAYFYDVTEGKLKLSTQSNKHCTADNSVKCNTAIYGSLNDRPICIKHKGDQGYNSSYLCSQALSIIEAAPNSPPIEGDGRDYSGLSGQDVYNEILTAATEEIASNQGGLADRSLNMMFDICLCGGGVNDPAPDDFMGNHPFSQPALTEEEKRTNFYAKYANAIFQSRTCYGILNQVDDIRKGMKAACQQNPALNQDQDYIRWFSYLGNIESELSDEMKSRSVDNYFSPANGSRYTNAERRELEQQDETNADLSREIYQTALSRGLCPVGMSALNLKLTKTQSTLIVEVDLNDATGVTLENLEIEIEEVTEDAELINNLQGREGNLFTFNYETPTSPITVRATTDLNGYKAVSNSVIVAPALALVAVEDGENIIVTYSSCVGEGNDCGNSSPDVPIAVLEDEESGLELGAESGGDAAQADSEASGNAAVRFQFTYPITQRPTDSSTPVTFNGAIGEVPVSTSIDIGPGEDTERTLTITAAGNELYNPESEETTDPDNGVYQLEMKITDISLKDEEGNTVDPLPDNFVETVSFHLESDSSTSLDKRVSDGSVYLRRPPNSQNDTVNVIAKYNDLESNKIGFDPFEGSCSIEKSDEAILVSLTVEGITNYSNDQHLKFTSATVNYGEESIPFQPGENPMAHLFTEEHSDEDTISVDGLSFNIAGITEAITCTLNETDEPVVAEAEPTSCEFSLAQTGNSRGGRPRIRFSATTEDELEFVWFNMNQAAEESRPSQDAEDPTDRMIAAADSEAGVEVEEDEKTEFDELYEETQSSKRLIGKAGNIEVTRTPSAFSIRVIALNKNGRACASVVKEVPPLPVNNSNPMQAPIAPVQKWGTRTIIEGI